MSLPATNDFDEPQELALYHSFPIGFPSQAWFPCTNLSCWRKSFSNSLPSQCQLPCLGAPLSGAILSDVFPLDARELFMQSSNASPSWSKSESELFSPSRAGGQLKADSIWIFEMVVSPWVTTFYFYHLEKWMSFVSFLTCEMGTNNNTPQSASFTGLFEYQITFYMWKSFWKNINHYTHITIKAYDYYCGSKLFKEKICSYIQQNLVSAYYAPGITRRMVGEGWEEGIV